MSVVLGLTLGDIAQHIKPYIFYLLAVVLSFSTTGIATSELALKKEIFGDMFSGLFLNYILFGLVLLPVAYILSPNEEIFYGFVVIAATPPGVAVIPFSYMLNGNLKKSILGTLGGFLASIVVAPLMIKWITGETALSFFDLFINMVKIIIIPLLFSRLLLLKPIKPFTEKVRGSVVNWGFAIIVFTAIGINRGVLLSDYKLVLNISLIFLIALFGLGQIFDLVAKKMGVNSENRMSFNLLLTIKSSGFSVVTAIAVFNNSAVVPSAVMSVFVLMYLLFLTFQLEYRNKRKK